MNKVFELDQQELLENFRYDADSGLLYWKKPGRNRVLSKPAGYVNKTLGYHYVGLSGIKLRSHRVIWVMHHGPIPDGLEINHIDLDKTNNRLENLELATPSGNIRHAHDSGAFEGTVSARTPVIGISEDGHSSIWLRSQGEANNHGFKQSNISHCLSGRRKAHRKYKWYKAADLLQTC